MPSSSELDRRQSESKETLNWDSSPECLELADPLDEFDNDILDEFAEPDIFHEAMCANKRDLKFSAACTDFQRVYEFDHVLPVQSSPSTSKAEKPKAKNKLKRLFKGKSKDRQGGGHSVKKAIIRHFFKVKGERHITIPNHLFINDYEFQYMCI